ncbi:MAG: toll/interleukin-1 receptor domain-containing protein [Gaiellaceae bacterium]
MADVFLSYSRRDGAFVQALRAQLAGAGRDIWVDSEDIPPAAQWEEDIASGIDGAASLVFVASASSLASAECGKELARAQEGKKRIVPVAIDGARPEDAPPALRGLNWIWWRTSDDAGEALAKLSSALDTDLEWLKAHRDLLERARAWERRQDGSLLLRGKDLAEQEQVVAANAGTDPGLAELQERYLHESRRSARRRQRTLLSGVTIALAVSIVLGVLALLQRNTARTETRKATSVGLASTANDRLDSRLDQALLLGLAAYSSNPSAQARNAVVSALESARSLGIERFLRLGADVRSLAFAPNGRWLAAGDAGGTVRIWDVRAHETIAELTAGKPVVSVAFARASDTLAVASDDGVVQLFDVRSGERVGKPFRARHAILTAAWSPDGRALAAGGADGGVWLWHLPSRSPQRLGAPTGNVAQLAFSPDGQTLAAGANDSNNPVALAGTVRLYDVASGKRVADLPVGWQVRDLAFAPGSRTLATSLFASGRGVEDHGELRLWKVRPRTRIGPLGRTLSSATSFEGVAFAPDGSTIAVARGNGTVRLLSPGDWKRSGGPLRGVGGAMVAFSSDGHTIAGAAVGGVRVSDLHDRGSFGRGVGSSGEASDVAVGFGDDGRTALVVDYDGGLRRVDVDSGKAYRPRRLRLDEFEQVPSDAFSPDGSILATGSLDSVQLWDMPGGGSPRALPMPSGVGGSITAVCFDRAGDVVAAVTDDGWVLVWDVADRRLLGHPLHASGEAYARQFVDAAFVGGSRTLLTAAADGSVARWDTKRFETSSPPVQLVETNVTHVALSPDGRTAAVGGDGKVWLWDVGSGAQAAELPGGVGGEVSGLAFSPDSRTLAVASQDLLVRLWDVGTRTPLGAPLGAGDAGAVEVTPTVAFSPDGRVLASGLESLRLWKGILWRDLADLRAQVCALVVGDLTPDEWKAIAPGLAYRRTCAT